MTDHLASKEDLNQVQNHLESQLASKEDLSDLKTGLAFIKGAMGLNIGLFFALAAFMAWLVHNLHAIRGGGSGRCRCIQFKRPD